MTKPVSAFFHGFLPLLAGAAFYADGMRRALPPTLLHYLPDALWAYALASLLFIIWDRRAHPLWLGIAAAVCVLFEYGQSRSFIPGTGDVLDIAAYILGGTAALFMNSRSIRGHKKIIKEGIST